jgi:hypothetical protein
MKPLRYSLTSSLMMAGLAIIAAASLPATTARAQDTVGDAYANREDSGTPAQVGHGDQEQGPVRLARFSFTQGSVTWRPDDSSEWSAAVVNLPLRQGAEVWVTDGGRAEIQFDDGSLLRLGNGGVAVLQTLYSDSDGEFTEVKLTGGVAALRLKHDHSVFQVDTPLVSVKSTGPSSMRVGVGDGVEVGVRGGAATVEGAAGTISLAQGDYLDLPDADAPLRARALPRGDSWELWNDERDQRLAASDADSRAHRLPPDIALVATDLNSNGDWREEPQYGWVWCPRVTVAEWRPYQYGHWTWVNPFGWTWVSNESWGWAPYHYGTWAHLARGWAWVPGPAAQCWSPAVVHFTECDSRVAWCPLAPSEVRYTTALALGVRGNSWSLYFSIGRAGVYYPTAAGYCEPRRFSTGVVNRGAGLRGGSGVAGRFGASAEAFAANSNTYLAARFVPINSRQATGVTAVAAAEFGGRSRYEAVGAAGSALFQRGRVVAAPPEGRAPVAGPAARPNMLAMTPTRTYIANGRTPSSLVAKPTFHAPLQPSIERSGAPARTAPTGPTFGRTPANSGAGSPSSARTGVPGRAGQGAGSDAGATGRTGYSPRTDVRPGQGGSVGDSAVERARAARRAVGAPGGPTTTGGVDTPGRSHAGPAGAGAPGNRSDYDGRRREYTPPTGSPAGGSAGRPAADDGRRRAPDAGPGRTYSPPANRDGTAAPGVGRTRVPDSRRNSPSTEPRRSQPNPPRKDRGGSGDKGKSGDKSSDKPKDKSADSSSPLAGRGHRG